MEISDRVRFVCNGTRVDVEAAPGESLLSVLRERLHLTSVKDGCAPQGQCGCCTVLVDGAPRVACVTPAPRVEGREVTTVEGLDAGVRDRLAAGLCASGGSQCGFCTPGIVVRLSARAAAGARSRAELDRALAAHLCRCTGWQTIYEAATEEDGARGDRDFAAASRRASIEGGVDQQVGPEVPLGDGGFADDGAPRDAVVAVPRAPGATVDAVTAAGLPWVTGASLAEARAHAAKVQGRRSGVAGAPPLPLPDAPERGVRLATGWVEPAYLEPDASWCVPGGSPASPLANGGAFGAKEDSPAPRAAAELAARLGRPVRVVLSREDTVRLGPKRPPVAAVAWLDDRTLRVDGVVAGDVEPFLAPVRWPYDLDEVGSWRRVAVPGPPTSSALRLSGIAERAVLLEGALDAAGAVRAALVTDERARRVLLDTCAPSGEGAVAGARVHLDADRGVVTGVDVRVAAGEILDHAVLRSYCIGATHMALGWVLTEGIAVGADGEVLDLTIRSFGILRPKSTPPIDVVVVEDDGPPSRGSDAVFAAVAGATWNAVARLDGRPDAFPARESRAAAAMRR